MVWLPDGEKILKLHLFILTEYTNVTDRRMDGWMDGQTLHNGLDSAYAQHHMAKTLLRLTGGYWQFQHM